MRATEAARKVVLGCSFALAVVAMIMIAGMMVTITYDVFVRFAFAAPTDWAYPLNAVSVLSSTMLVVPYLYAKREHIAMDLVHRAMPRPLRRVADVATAAATAVLGVVLAAMAFRSMIVAIDGGLTGSGTFNIPLWIPDAMLVLTGVFLVLVAVLFPPTAPEDPLAAVPGGAATEPVKEGELS